MAESAADEAAVAVDAVVRTTTGAATDATLLDAAMTALAVVDVVDAVAVRLGAFLTEDVVAVVTVTVGLDTGATLVGLLALLLAATAAAVAVADLVLVETLTLGSLATTTTEGDVVASSFLIALVVAGLVDAAVLSALLEVEVVVMIDRVGYV